MTSTKKVFKTDDRFEQYMQETQEYIVTLKSNLLKKILILQQNKRSTNPNIIEVNLNSSNQITTVNI